ncbi:uncharacterized protein BCR38DRAFT_181549 [Pseudomassariella vexata]|uniref:BHLH domain-containing protein n=1 Tax=Pseudomassariella vexata TaxID=1141098 RepID=A0A1Y2E4N4_9PEZI|nr:uncharacterized protein BCR38DRAFT_181549 [Pseudomassariella vexata]ORY66479.1 hypothetical protein BCR38DRAFT_181549 [Pseudomassariella vexata]
MAQYGFNQFGGGQNNGSGSIDPNDLAMSGYGNGNAMFTDDDLLGTLDSHSPTDANQPTTMNNQGQEFNNMNGMSMGFPQSVYASHQVDQSHINGYSNTPEGDPIQSPFVHSYGGQPQFRQMQHQHQHQPFGNSLQSPISYSGSPHTGNDANNDGEPNYLNAKSNHRLSQAQAQAMQRKASNTRSPLTSQTATAMANLTVGSHESPGFATQPIRTPSNTNHEKSPSAQWMHTPNSMSSFPGTGFSSPLQQGIQHPHIGDVIRTAGTSMPTKLGGVASSHATAQEIKRKRRRESHNLVERRRRDNINERIQDLSKLVPMHRLEDEKIRKLIQNGTPLSPTLTGISQPGQATSGLAGPGAKRATGAGSITTGLPIEDKDKGPNKGDILNGAVSWTRDLMWMLHMKLQQQEELMNHIAELGGSFPLELTDDEKRMQTELMETIAKNEVHNFSYSRYDGSGLRVPHHTDYKGESLNGGSAGDPISVSPEDHNGGDLTGDLGNPNEFWNDPDDDVKEEDEYGMDLTV